MTSQSPAFSKESHYQDAMSGPIAALWEQRQEGTFHGHQQCPIGWVHLISRPHNDKVIVVVNGRVETYWKYQELFFDFVQQGYDVYALDHRGQGVSGRLVDDNEMGYVEHFDDYVTDLQQFIDHVVLPQGYQHHYLLGHSMGGAIASLYLSHSPNVFERAVLSAPMHGIYVEPTLKPFMMPLIGLIECITRQPRYAFGQKPYYAKPFDGNLLTGSHPRYQWFRDLYEARPDLRIGGASNHWVWESLKAVKTVQHCAASITTPLLLLQGSDDRIVCNQAQHRFAQCVQHHGGQCDLQVIQGAHHELLFEVDPLRNQALIAMLQHFA